MKKTGSTLITAAATGAGVAVYGWAAALVLVLGLASVVFMVSWVLSDSERSARFKEILSVIYGARRW